MIALLLLACAPVHDVRPAPPMPGPALVFEEIGVEPQPADVLYRRARRWFSLAFNDAETVLDLEDPVDHVLIAKASMGTPGSELFMTADTRTSYRVTVETQEARFRIVVGPFQPDGLPVLTVDEEPPVWDWVDDVGRYVVEWQAAKSDATTLARGLILSLRDEMARPTLSPEPW